MTESTALVNWEERLAEMARDEARKERPTGSNIGTRAGVLTYNGQPVPGNKLDVIIIASTHANLYYDKPFDADNPVNPVCWAYGDDEHGMAPDSNVPNPISDNCDTCPKNAWGSDERPGGGRGKACQNRRTLALIPAATAPSEVPTAEIAVLKLPVMSGNNFKMYAQKCDALHRRPTMAMVTQIGSVPDQKSQFKITFTDVKPVDVSMMQGIFDRASTAIEVIRPAYEANAEAAPAPQGEAKPGAKKKF